jgi:diguanylate cyclase (GGDEF)-like protein/PAS domain S-box-containing protein
MTAQPFRLLVVDDDPTNRDLLSRRLERRGYAVVTAASGQEALDLVAAQAASMVLLDIEMPGMSGLEVLQILRRTWSASELPVLMVTAKDQSEDIVTALDLGANDYITKPIDFAVALARIRTQLSRKEAEERMRASEERYALASRGTNDGLWDWDLTTGVIHYSARWKEIIGCAETELGSGPDEWFSRVHSEDLPRLHRTLDEHLSGRTRHFECEHRMRHASGAFRWVLTRGLAVRNVDGRSVRMAGSQSDITEGKVVDALTGLPNRMLLIDRVERALEHHRLEPGGQFAILFLDLDGFKVINDSLGHLAGDQLLQAVARRLEASLRVSDTVTRPAVHRAVVEHTLARLGGDEFVILLNAVRSVVDATRIAERIQFVLTAPFQVAEREVFTSASIGIAVATSLYATAQDVLRDADTAMYRAKALGKGRSEVFDASMREEVMQRLQLDTSLRLALERHEFIPYYQPIIDLKTGQLSGFEALLRWNHPERGIVEPAAFVPVVDENGLIVPIGRRFSTDVCRQLRTWCAGFPQASGLTINVNFSAPQFLDARLLDDLLETLDDAGVRPDQLVVEITESSAISDLARAVAMLTRLRDAGLLVVLDDFGTGYSSLSCLHKLPISGIKLDRSFVARETREPAVLKAVIVLARQLGLKVTAEGIETREQRDLVRALECDYAQGYLFSHPVNAEAATTLINPGSWFAVGSAVPRLALQGVAATT